MMRVDILKKSVWINIWFLTLQMKIKSNKSNKIKEVSNSEHGYKKDYMKIIFNSDGNLPLNKLLKFNLMTITVRSAFKEDGKLYPKLFLDDTLYDLNA